MRLPFLMIPVLMTALSACSEFPELDDAVSSDVRKARYPDLVPLETLTGQVPETQIAPKTPKQLEARVKRLKARANRMKRPVIDKRTEERMQAGVN